MRGRCRLCRRMRCLTGRIMPRPYRVRRVGCRCGAERLCRRASTARPYIGTRKSPLPHVGATFGRPWNTDPRVVEEILLRCPEKSSPRGLGSIFLTAATSSPSASFKTTFDTQTLWLNFAAAPLKSQPLSLGWNLFSAPGGARIAPRHLQAHRRWCV